MAEKPTVEEIQDPNFTRGLRSEVYLELLREGLLDGHAHEEINRLRGLLTPFALAYDSAPDYLKDGPDTVCIWDTEPSNVITIGDLRRARAEVGNV